GFLNTYPTFRKESTKDNLRMPTIRQQTASSGGCECIRDLTPICPRAATLHCHPSGKNREKKMRRNGYSRGVWVSALVHATPDATASRFAGRSANKTPPITMKTTTSVKSLWTP